MNALQSYIYAIKAVGTNRYKIGTTTDLKGRLATVQTGCPYPAQIVATWEGDRRLETAIHRELAEYRRVGEWFECDFELIRLKIESLLPVFCEMERSAALPQPRRKASRPITGVTDGNYLWRFEWASSSKNRDLLRRRRMVRSGDRWVKDTGKGSIVVVRYFDKTVARAIRERGEGVIRQLTAAFFQDQVARTRQLSGNRLILPLPSAQSLDLRG